MGGGKGRVVSGYRPSGRLHLGHYHGNLKVMTDLQKKRDCFFFVADWHALTTEYRDTSMLWTYTKEMVLDWLAAGLDPQECTIYRQSDIKHIPELMLYFSMITSLGELERCPTYKQQLRELDERLVNTYGFLGYPVLMAADILIIKGSEVPVGEDQVPHLELTRGIARKFNALYGSVFPEPSPILSQVPRILGTDGRKMSKSYGNYIDLLDSEDDIRAKVRKMITDPARVRRSDRGHPDVCSVFDLYRAYSSRVFPEERAKECLEAKVGCIDCKDEIARVIYEDLSDFREKRKTVYNDESIVAEILNEGAKKVMPIAGETLEEVRSSIRIAKI